MQRIELYGQIIKSPVVNFLKNADKDISVITFDLQVDDNNKKSTTIFHAITFNDLGQEVIESLKKDDFVYINGIMKKQEYIQQGQSVDNLVLLIKNIDIDGIMHMTKDIEEDINNMKILNMNKVYV